jgi:ribosomal protein S15P/S13E
MSIFGVQKQSGDIRTLAKHIQDLQNHLRPVKHLEQRIVDLEQKDKQTKDLLKYLIDKNSDFDNKVRNLKDTSVISIFAENRGAIKENDILSFGSGGKRNGAGYVMIRKGRILGISLSSIKKGGEVTVGIYVDGNILPGCEITLHTAARKHDIFDTPFNVEAGSVINFVSKVENKTTDVTVASLLIELY